MCFILLIIVKIRCYKKSERYIVIRLIIITTIPTAMNIFLIGSFAVKSAEKGAVMIPPINNPATIFQ